MRRKESSVNARVNGQRESKEDEDRQGRESNKGDEGGGREEEASLADETIVGLICVFAAENGLLGSRGRRG